MFTALPNPLKRHDLWFLAAFCGILFTDLRVSKSNLP